MARLYRYRISFRSKNQLPWFLFYIEYFNDPNYNNTESYDLDYQIEFARIIFAIG